MVMTVKQVANRHGVDVGELTAWIRQVNRFSRRHLEFPDLVRADLVRPTRSGKDHPRRVRLAQLLALPRPARPTQQPAPAEFTPAELGLIRAASGILAATGPIPLEQLTAALIRRMKPLHTRPWDPAGAREIPVDRVVGYVRQLVDRAAVATVHADRLSTPITASYPAPPRWAALVDAARRSGRTRHTSIQMYELLAAAGHTGPNLAQILTYHPLATHHGWQSWSILGAD